jgi:hypothetical protein
VNDGVGITQAHIHCAGRRKRADRRFPRGVNPAGYDVGGNCVSNATLAESMRTANAYTNGTRSIILRA